MHSIFCLWYEIHEMKWNSREADENCIQPKPHKKTMPIFIFRPIVSTVAEAQVKFARVQRENFMETENW